MAGRTQIKILLADNRPIIRWAIKHALAASHGDVTIQLIECSSVPEAAAQIHLNEPNVVLAGSFSQLPPVEAAKALMMHAPGRVFVLYDEEHESEALSFSELAGIGCASVQSDVEGIVSAILTAATGTIRSTLKQQNPSRNSWDIDLSKRELETLTLVARGLTSRQIAEQLCISPKTVETHRLRIYRKLGVTTRAQLIEYVFANRLLVAA